MVWPPKDPVERRPLALYAAVLGLVLGAGNARSSSDVLRLANELYQRTDYVGSLRLLAGDPAPDTGSYVLMGKNYFMSGNYKKATEYFQRAGENSEAQLWLGRTWGRRAETGNVLMAAPDAIRARQSFERAIALDPQNREAKNDLFSFYLEAPALLGGGIEKAEAAAKSIALERPAEYEFEEARIAEQRKDLAAAETHLRRAMELAPAGQNRVIDSPFQGQHGAEAFSLSVPARWRRISPRSLLRRPAPTSITIAISRGHGRFCRTICTPI